MIKWWFSGRSAARRKIQVAAETLYRTAIEQARRDAFYADMGVPDTVDGRFDLITLHVVLLIRRLGSEGEAGAALAQALFDTMFADMDKNLREMGVGDLSVGKRVKAMATAFYGRAKAYETGLASEDASLEEALKRNLFGTVEATAEQIGAAARYTRAADAALAEQDGTAIVRGRAEFPLPRTGPAA